MAKKTILLTNGRSPAGLDLMRTFRRFGHRVIVAESLPVHLCKFSRHGKSVRVPPPKQNPRDYVEALKGLVEKYSVDLLIPIYEEIFWISRYRDEFPDTCEICCDRVELLQRLHHKFEFIQLANELGLSHPQTRLVHSVDEAIDGCENKVLKPIYSRFGTEAHIRPNAETVRNLDFSTPWVMQEFVDGRPLCVYCFADRGEILATSSYPMDVTLLGVSISFRHEPMPIVDAWVKSFVSQTRFSGSISFDFLVKDSAVYPIECNPRVTSGIHLFSHDQKFVEAIVNKQPHPSPTYHPAIIGPFVFLKALRRWSLWKTYWQGSDVLFKWFDPFPLFGQFALVAHLRSLSRRHGKPVNQVSTLDIEYNGDPFP